MGFPEPVVEHSQSSCLDLAKVQGSLFHLKPTIVHRNCLLWQSECKCWRMKTLAT